MGKCKCIRCQKGKKFVMDEEERLLTEYGWYAHMYTSFEGYPFEINYHTHGFGYQFHPDIQICFPMEPEHAHQIFVDLYSKIKIGAKFIVGQRYDGILQEGFQVTFFKINDNRIRLIIPDEDNNVNPEEMRCPYKHQYDV